jgi:hypothetical protein
MLGLRFQFWLGEFHEEDDIQVWPDLWGNLFGIHAGNCSF